MAPEEGSVFTEPIIAWRVWRVVLRQDSEPLAWELQSVSRSDVWPFRARLEAYGDCRFTPKMIATLPMAMRNISVPHPAPGFECFCGIHAYAKAEDACTYLDFISVRGMAGTHFLRHRLYELIRPLMSFGEHRRSHFQCRMYACGVV